MCGIKLKVVQTLANGLIMANGINCRTHLSQCVDEEHDFFFSEKMKKMRKKLKDGNKK